MLLYKVTHFQTEGEVTMSMPVVSGEDVIELIDKHGCMVWRNNNTRRNSVLIESSTELYVGAVLIRVKAKLVLPEYFMVDSPLFSHKSNWCILLRRMIDSPSGFKMAELPKIATLPGICRTHQEKIFKPVVGIRWLIVK